MEKQQGFAEVNGTRLYYEVAGTGEPLVLIHGFSLDSRFWQDQVAAFARHYRVVCYDVRGFGRSAPPTGESYSSVDDLKALLAYLGIARAAVLGLSMGGGIAGSFALAYPEATRALIAVDSNLWGYEWSPEFVAASRLVGSTARKAGVAAARALWLASPLFASALESPEPARRLRQIVGDYSGWHWLNRDPERGLDPPTIRRLEQVAAPTLVVVGERDLPDFQTIAELLAQRIPGARKAVLPGRGHLASLEDPGRFNEIVLSFLANLAGAATIPTSP